MKTIILVILLYSSCETGFSQFKTDSSNIRASVLFMFKDFPGNDSENIINYAAAPFGNVKPKKIRDAELMELTNHPKASVRVYATEALINRNHEMVWVLLDKHAADTADWLLLPSECQYEAMTLVDFLLEDFAVNTQEHPFTESQALLVKELKMKRKESIRYYWLKRYLQQQKSG